MKPGATTMEKSSGVQDSPCLRALTEPVRNAQLLLAYAAEAGIDLQPETVKAIVRMRHCCETGKLPTDLLELEAQFVQATKTLAKAVNPVTVISLRASYDKRPDLSLIGRFRALLWRSPPQVSLAALSVRRFRFWAFVVLVLLLFVQIYWVIGSSLTTDVDTTLKQKGDEEIQLNLLRQEQRQLSRQQKALFEELPAKGAQKQEEIEAALKKIDGELEKKLYEVSTIEARVATYALAAGLNYEILGAWNNCWKWPAQQAGRLVGGHQNTGADNSKPAEAAYQGGRQNTGADNSELAEAAYQELLRAQKTAKFALNAMQLYLLPILYGLLGAITYVLRTLAEQIRTLTYTPETDIGFRLRMNLGALAGLVIVWFIKKDGEAQLPFESLSQYAIAFAAGYSVELLFAAMDRVIGAFSSNTAAQESRKAPASQAQGGGQGNG
jgi:hypothetical protein